MPVPPGPWDEEIRRAEVVANELVSSEGELKILEAGCGSSSHFTFRGPTYLVGIDLSREAVECHPRLDERRIGDIEVDPLGVNEYDAVVCWYVLEHLRRPEAALANMRAALKEGGLLVLAVPNVLSVKGLVTKFTPYSFHRWFYRYIFRHPPELQPFPTVLARVLSPPNLVRYAESHAWRVEYLRVFEAGPQKSLRYKIWLIGGLWGAICRLTTILTGGFVDAENTEVVALLRKATPGVARSSG